VRGADVVAVDEAVDDRSSEVVEFGEMFGFFSGKFAKDEVFVIYAVAQVVIDADAEPCGIWSEMVAHRLYAVVPCVRAAMTGADGAKRQCELVMDDEDVLGCDFVEVCYGSSGLATEVVERRGFGENYLFAVHVELGDVGLELVLVLERPTFLVDKVLQSFKTRVVAGIFVLFPGISEADDQFHICTVVYRIDKSKQKRYNRYCWTNSTPSSQEDLPQGVEMPTYVFTPKDRRWFTGSFVFSTMPAIGSFLAFGLEMWLTRGLLFISALLFVVMMIGFADAGLSARAHRRARENTERLGEQNWTTEDGIFAPREPRFASHHGQQDMSTWLRSQ